MIWLAELLRDVPGYILIGAFAMVCGLGFAWLVRDEDWFLEDDCDYIVSSMYGFKRGGGR